LNSVQLHSIHPLRSIPVSVYNVSDLITDLDKSKIINNTLWRQYKDLKDCVDISVSYKFLEENNMLNLLTKINSCVDNYIQDTLGLKLKLKPIGSWVTKQTEGGNHSAHSHPNTLISAVTYFNNLGEDISSLVFKNNGFDDIFSNFKGFSLSSRVINWNPFNNFTYNINPEVDQVIIFPGHLEHYSDINVSGVRYCVGVNYFIDDTLGKDDNKNTITLSC
jgi:uncharacterized protein (TIGR02466 family)